MERRKQHFLQKLYSREIHGSFFRGRPAVQHRAIKLFGSIPERLTFLLQDLFDSRNDHVLIGTTRCGQFLMTYSYTVDVRHSMRVQYKYRLHWWAFRGATPAHKVAEVQLFDTKDVSQPLHIGIAQWPNVNDRMIVYGCSDCSDFLYDPGSLDIDNQENRKYYITVTTLPSLHNCRDCKAVAESFDEEDMAAIWDRAISFSCLRHGLTIHTTLDVAAPYPTFNPLTSLKIDNKIIVNTGNFLHVLSFALDKEEKRSTERDTIVPDEINHGIGEMLSNSLRDYNCPWKKLGDTSSPSVPARKTLSKSINKAWLNTIMDKANKVYAFEESDDGCEPRFKWFKKRRLADKMYEFCSEDEDMENKCPAAKIPRLESVNKKEEKDLDKEHRLSRTLVSSDGVGVPTVHPERPIFIKPLLQNLPVCRGRCEQTEITNRITVPNSSICDSDVSNKCDIKSNKSLDHTGSQETSVISQQNLDDADFIECDLYSNSDSPVGSLEFSFLSDKLPVMPAGEIKQDSVDINCKSSNTPSTLPFDSHTTSSMCEIRAVPSISDHSEQKLPPLDISVINPDLSAILAEWEADSVSSLSPRSDSLTKNDVIQSFLELIPGMTFSPRSSGTSSSTGTSENLSPKVRENVHSATKMSSPNSPSVNKYSPLLVVLRTRNCNQDKEPQKSKEQEDRLKAFAKEDIASKVSVKSTKEPDVSLRQRMISGCSVCFDRIYIELDDEIISTISTDFEDDDQGTGFHCALPLSVHGSAYAQLQMVSSQKAEKLSMDCERVFQTSFDIEQFCFKAADIICQCEGFKFWFCSDYDVELIDVCTLNGDVLAVVCMRVNAEEKPPVNTENKPPRGNLYSQRCFYSMKCVFVWNPMADRCWLEAYTPLVLNQGVSRIWTAPAQGEAKRLRRHMQTTSLFTLPSYPPIRTFEHRMWSYDFFSPSVEELRDYKNLICFILKQRAKGRTVSHVAEFWG